MWTVLTLEKGEIDIEEESIPWAYSDIKNTGKQAESILGRLFKWWLSAQQSVSRQPHLGYPYWLACMFLLYDIFPDISAESCHTGNFWTVWRIFFTGSLYAVVFVMLYPGKTHGAGIFPRRHHDWHAALLFSAQPVCHTGSMWWSLGRFLVCSAKYLVTILLPFRKHGKKIIHFFRKRLKKVCRAVKIGLCKL